MTTRIRSNSLSSTPGYLSGAESITRASGMTDLHAGTSQRRSGTETPDAISPSGTAPARGSGDVAGPMRLLSGSSKTNMMRLPDEPPLAGSGSAAALAPGRPGSGSSSHLRQQQQPAMSRLPDERPGSASLFANGGSGSRPGSATTGQSGLSNPVSSLATGRKPSLSRLPDELLPSQAPMSRPPSAGQSSGGQNSATTPSNRGNSKQQGGVRDRLNNAGIAKLTVATDNATINIASRANKAPTFRLLKESETVHDFYEFAEEIYSGGAKGKVLVAKKKSDNMEVIVKIRTKRSNKGTERSWRAIMAQLQAMRGSNHVLDITEILEDDTAFYVIMPKCNGGELFDFLVTETEVPETECKRIIREILTAVGHLHKGGLVHRDIKPENIMFDLADMQAKTPKTVKLIDFDTCVEWTPASPKSSRFVGTPGYIAPEALLGEITPQSDLWSIGVILYILMVGETPWSSMVSLEDGTVGSPGATRMYNALKAEVLEWDREPWPDFPLARDFCQRLIAFNCDERPLSVQDALDHEWLRD